ncbi:unnamed protein product, partial [Ectocarpus sp. 12 AP-2014]
GREGRAWITRLAHRYVRWAWRKEKETSDHNNNTSGTQDTAEMQRAIEKRAASRSRPRVFDRQTLVWRHARQKEAQGKGRLICHRAEQLAAWIGEVQMFQRSCV